MNTNRRCALTGVACLAALGAMIALGPLTPPGGAVTGTAKPLSEVEPRTAINATNTPGDAGSVFKITQPGSYYLTGNVTGVSGKHGISISASGVTLDLNGFDLAGVSGAVSGVASTANSLTGIRVLNGTIHGWGSQAVDLGLFPVLGAHVEGVRAYGNAGTGFNTGPGTTLTDCTASGSAANGFFVGLSCKLVRCVAYANLGSGIVTGFDCSVTDCAAYANTGTGISVSGTCTVSNCVAYNNDGNGIGTGNGSVVADCTAYANTLVGITVSAGCTVTGCASAQNTGNGITTNVSCTVRDCAVYSNDGIGINAIDGTTVSGCAVRGSTLDGIKCSVGCLILNNTCTLSGASTGDGAGIHATSSDNRIEGNVSTGADRGVDVDAAGNIIIRNTCSGNTTDWDIVANNIFGPIIDRRTPASAAVTGFSAASTLGSTDPNANFSY